MYNIDEVNSDIVFEVNGKQVAFKLKKSSFNGEPYSPIYLIRTGDLTEPTDDNTYSAKKIISLIGALGNSDNKLDKAIWDKAFDIDAEGNIIAKQNLYGLKGITAYGKGNGGEAGTGGGLIKTVYGYEDLSRVFANTNYTDTFNAYTIAKLAESISNHNHTIADVIGLQTILDSKVDASMLPTSAEKSNWDTAYNFVCSITGADTDTIINKWAEVVDFLNGIDSSNTLQGLINNINDAVSSETTRATNAETALGNRIDGIHTHSNKSVIDGITSTLVSNWNTAYTNSHTHSNKSVLDGITSALITNWNDANSKKHTHSNISALDLITLDADGNIKIDANVYSTGGLSAYGQGSSSGGGSGTIQTVYGYSDINGVFSDSSFDDTFNAYTIAKLASRIASVESGALTSVDWSIINGRPTALSFFTNDSGFITSSALPTKTSQLTNDSGFLTSHQSLSGYATQSWVNANFNNYSLPTASSSVKGGILIGYAQSGKNYPVTLDTNGKAYVNVPWTDTNTTYGVATTSANGLMTAAMVTKLNGIAEGATNFTYTLPTATSSVLGGIKVGTGLGISSSILSVSYGTVAGTACQGNDSRLSNARPASDVYAWAKASSKPSYTYSEVGAAAASHSHSYLPLSGGTMTGVITSTYTSDTWINSVSNSALTLNHSGYGGIFCAPVKDGRITMATYPASNNYVYLGYATAAQIKAGTNAHNVQTYWDAANGIWYANGYKNKNGTSVSYEGHTHSQYLTSHQSLAAYATTAWVNSNFNNYSLPTATSSALGGIKVGTGLGISSSVLSVSYGSSAGTACQGNDSRLSNSRPASDVYAWAKASSKPSYTKSEVGLGNVDNTSDANKSVRYAASAGAVAWGNVTSKPGVLDKLSLDANGNIKIAGNVYATGGVSAYADGLQTGATIGWADISNKPTTLSGYGITDAVSSSDSRLTNARPASDVYSWAKASVKPTYTASEVGAAAAGHTHSGYATLTASSYGTSTWYRKWDDGFLECGGKASRSSTYNICYLPISFYDTNYFVVASISASDHTGSHEYHDSTVCDKTKTSFYLRTYAVNSSQSSNGIYWYACGRWK